MMYWGAAALCLESFLLRFDCNTLGGYHCEKRQGSGSATRGVHVAAVGACLGAGPRDQCPGVAGRAAG
eukprot:7995223-Pyramimonas_sp.AAC.1